MNDNQGRRDLDDKVRFAKTLTDVEKRSARMAQEDLANAMRLPARPKETKDEPDDR